MCVALTSHMLILYREPSCRWNSDLTIGINSTVKLRISYCGDNCCGGTPSRSKLVLNPKKAELGVTFQPFEARRLNNLASIAKVTPGLPTFFTQWKKLEDFPHGLSPKSCELARWFGSSGRATSRTAHLISKLTAHIPAKSLYSQVFYVRGCGDKWKSLMTREPNPIGSISSATSETNPLINHRSTASTVHN